MMTGEENYRRCIEFRKPEYLPVYIGCDFAWLYEKNERKTERIRELMAGLPDDIYFFRGDMDIRYSEEVSATEKRWFDLWGTGWADDGHGAKTCSYPIEAGYDRLGQYTFPVPSGENAPADLEVLREGGKGRYLGGLVWFTLFERLWMLRGFNNMLMDPYLDTGNFDYLRGKILDFNLQVIDKWMQQKLSAVYFSDDWGTQRGLLMDPQDWRKYYKPAYRAMFESVRGAGAQVWMHLCGDVSQIVPDLVDIGLNVLNPVQPQAMSVQKLARDFGGRLCFCGGVDVQGTLIRGTPEDVRKEVFTLVDLFGGYGGGYIGSTSHSIMPETPLDNVIALFEAFRDIR
jgi:uroporphyrinogen decarboxylase